MAYVLDTDVISALQRTHPLIIARLRTLPPSELFVTIISFEEQIAGRLNVLNKQLTGTQRIEAYLRLRQTLDFYAAANVLLYDERVARIDENLRLSHRRMGTKDRRIAAITLMAGATLVTRNTVDFQGLPGLSLEDWFAP